MDRASQKRPPDLLRVVDIMWQRRILIGSLTTLAAAAVFVASMFLTPRYESSTVLAFEQPVVRSTFSNRIRTSDVEIGEGIGAIARSEAQIHQLMQQGKEQGWVDPSIRAESFVNACSARMVSDRLLKLTVKGKSPEVASALADAWANQLIVRVSRVYGATEGDLNESQELRLLATKELEQAQANLTKHLEQARIEVRESRLDQATDAATSFRNKINRLRLLETEARRVLSQLNATDPPEDSRLELGLSLAVLGLQSDNTAALKQLQVQIGESMLAGNPVRVNAARQGLHELLNAWSQQRDTLEQQVAALDDQIQDLALGLEQAQHERQLAASVRNRAREAVDVLAEQEHQLKMLLATQSSMARIAAEAVPSEEPVWPKPVLFSLAAGVLAFLLSTAGCVMSAEWRGSESAH